MFEFVDQRTYVKIGENYLDNVGSTDFPGYTPGKKNETSWDFEGFKHQFKVTIIKKEDNFLEFDFIGLDCSIANSLRRIMISEIPIMAIEKVHYYLNTSVFQEEFLAHRLGLIPIKANPKLFEFPSSERNSKDEHKINPTESIVFELKAKCSPNTNAARDCILQEDIYLNRNVYSKHLKWEPIGEQEQLFASDPPRPVDDDILIAKLSPGQELDLKLVCEKGIGRDHAKYSPVCTAFYRFMPFIQIDDGIFGEDAKKLQKCFSPGVIELNKAGLARLANPRYDSGSRNVFLYPELKDRVKLGMKNDHFIFNVETTGSLTSSEVVMESIQIMLDKCKKYLDDLEKRKNFKEDPKVKKEPRQIVQEEPETI